MSESYVQPPVPGARLRTFIAAASDFGALAVAGAASLGGTLVLDQAPPFETSLGQTFPILTSFSLTGSFASVTENEIGGTGRYYEPTYSATTVTLLVR